MSRPHSGERSVLRAELGTGCVVLIIYKEPVCYVTYILQNIAMLVDVTGDQIVQIDFQKFQNFHQPHYAMEFAVQCRHMYWSVNIE